MHALAQLALMKNPPKISQEILGTFPKQGWYSLNTALRESSLLSIGVILAVSLLLMLPIWWFGLAVNSHDTRAHASWQYLFSMQFWNGEIYPRWLAEMNEGFGSPSFYIYPPLSQFAAVILAPFSDSAAWVYQRLGIAATVAYFVGGVGTYLWLFKVTQDRISALCGALLFLVSPYHLLTDTYIRAAYAELWAFTWAPFSLLGLHLFKENVSKALIMYTLATAGLLLSHAPSCIALLPAYLAYAAVLSRIEKDKRIFVWSVVGMGLALLIAGAYLGTALTHQKYINNSSLFSGYFEFKRWFVGARERWPSAGSELVIGATAVLQFFVAALSGFLVLRRGRVDTKHRALAILSMFVCFATLCMVLPFSLPVWEIVPFIQKIQFPWRLLTTQTVFFSLACALYVKSVRSGNNMPHVRSSERLMFLFILVLMIANAVMTFYSQPEFTHSSPLRVRDTAEYQMGNIDKANALFAAGEKTRMISGQGTISIELSTPRYMRIRTVATTDITFLVHQFNYPDWQCTTLNILADCKVTGFTSTLPVAAVSTGPGNKIIELRLSSAAERLGHFASILGICLLVIFCLGSTFFARKNNMGSACVLPEPALQ